MLRQFHYIDQNGKDQGINVRNRSKELAELLGDVERIRSERKKARANRNKFGGVEGGAMSSGLSGGSRYGGFGSDEAGYGGYSGGVYGDGGGFGGRDPTYQDTSARRDRFEEYDEYDEGGSSAPARRKPEAPARETEKPAPPKPKEPAVDFLSFDEDVPPKTPPKDFSKTDGGASASLDNGLGSLSARTIDEDDFDDFQSATPTTTASSRPSIPSSSMPSIAAPTPQAPPQDINLSTLSSAASSSPGPGAVSALISPPQAPAANYSITSRPAPNYNVNMSAPPPQQSKPLISPQPQPQSQRPTPTNYQAAAPNYFTSVPTPQASSASTPGSARPSFPSHNSFTANKAASATPTASGGDAFGSLWSSASSSAGIKKTTIGGAQGPNLASLQREKASQGIWGHSAAPATGITGTGTLPQPAPMGAGVGTGQKSGGGSASNDLLG